MKTDDKVLTENGFMSIEDAKAMWEKEKAQNQWKDIERDGKIHRVYSKEDRDKWLEHFKREDIRKRIEREQENLKTIKDYVLWYLDKNQGSRRDMTPDTVLAISKVMLGYTGDVIVFDNGPGLFDVWIKEDKPNFVPDFLKHLKGRAYAYRINGVTTIKNHPWIPSHYYDPEYYEKLNENKK